MKSLLYVIGMILKAALALVCTAGPFFLLVIVFDVSIMFIGAFFLGLSYETLVTILKIVDVFLVLCYLIYSYFEIKDA